MAQVYVKYNPYRMETQIEVNGKAIASDSILKLVKGKRLQEWIGKFPKMLVDELHTLDFEIEFYGMDLDWDDFEDAFEQAKEAGLIKSLKLTFTEGKSDEDITEKVVQVFEDLQSGPVEDFRNPKLIQSFQRIQNNIFPINVIATMSSGKSTLINALLGKKLMPSKNEACTATITEILDNDAEQFEAVVYDEGDVVLREVSDLTYDIMNELNEDENVHRIAAEGNIPFLDAKSTALMLVDTPGPNNSQNQAHKNTTYQAISNDSNNLILYVLNGTQLSTNDDAALLSYVSDQIQKGGKQVRDRFLFVVNKMDGFNPEEEDIGKAIAAAKKYLASYGIEDPQIFPCSAFTALNIRTCLDGVDIDNLTRSEERKLPQAARDTLPMIDKFIEYDSMHLEQYTTLAPSVQKELEYKLNQAQKDGDTREQALIHCGIYSIEAAIKAYVKKYAKTKKVKDLVESFQEVLESTKVFAKAKEQVAADEQAARECAERAAIINEKIADGKEAKLFKDRIDRLDPMPAIEQKAEELKENASKKASRIFAPYGSNITSRDEAKRLTAQFGVIGSDYTAEMSAELESVINREIKETGEKMLTEYQEKLTKFDEDVSGEKLDFGTADLIQGALNDMKADAAGWNSDSFVSDIADDVGEVTHEEKIKEEVVGQRPEQVVDGTERVKIGTRKVWNGTRREKTGTRRVKVGSHQEQTGTRTVRNPNKKGIGGFFKFWEPKYVEEAVYTTVDDYRDEDVYETRDVYKDEDVYETRVKYKTVMKDVIERHTEKIERYSAKTSEMQAKLIGEFRKNLDEGINNALHYAQDQVDGIKEQFTGMFDKLDKLIQERYAELQQCAETQKNKEAELEKNRKLLVWIESNITEIDGILNI